MCFVKWSGIKIILDNYCNGKAEAGGFGDAEDEGKERVVGKESAALRSVEAGSDFREGVERPTQTGDSWVVNIS